MLSDDNNSGLLTFMIGLIVVVMVGVGLSVLIDSRFSFSRNTRDLEASIASDKEEINRLTAMTDEVQSQFAEQQPKLKTAQTQLKEFESSISDKQAKIQGLIARRDEITKSIPPLEEQFASYRKTYREQTWANAVGESLGNIEVRGGRVYRNSVIKLVTEVGLEIRHEDGVARVQGPDLSLALQDRFQWDDAERTRRLEKELADHNSIKDPSQELQAPPKPMPVKQAAPRTAPAAPVDQAKIDSARKKVTAWRTRVFKLSSEKATAQSNAYSSQTSVPGSLETWQAKAARLTSELAKAKGELAAAKAELKTLSPGDLMLQPEPAEDSGSGF